MRQIITAIITIAIAGAAFAQQPPGPVPSGGNVDNILATKYKSLLKAQLEEKLKGLQKEIIIAEKIAETAKNALKGPMKAYESAIDHDKADKLIPMLAARAAANKAGNALAKIKAEFQAAQVVYVELLEKE